MSDSVEQKVTRKYVKKPNVVYGRPCINKTPEAIKKKSECHSDEVVLQEERCVSGCGKIPEKTEGSG